MRDDCLRRSANWWLGTPPAPRVAASLNKLPSGDFLLHGGWTPKGDKETFAESHVLDLGM